MWPVTPQETPSARPGDIHPPPTRRGGFTLVEIVLVVTIVGLLAGIAAQPMNAALNHARVARAIGEISSLQKEIAMHEAERGSLPLTLNDIGRGGLLDPWGRPYQYLNFAGSAGGGGGKGGGGGGGGGGGNLGLARKDRFLVPINSTYDLYSNGADGKTAAALTASVSRDDVVRGNDGSYIGLASGY